ncbi:GtrA family protein [Solwaraspora sp. WMMD406]|uniref:GtrA family protein n=1 Tax=Solwaraspora sp. WMMD406 TaxID=3016095 RepID=UPI00241806B8|nr:GtrA family protein [Solwaraspora sp. WMMD406]MDG4767855.1 GtrA family protein [Solwaraspora sp. WMMD406]
MRLLRLVPDRWQRLVREVLKFGTVGGINTVINFAVFNALALTILSDGQLKATVIAAVVATTSSYFMNRHWTYRDRPKSAIRREYVLFFLFNATGLMIEVGVLALAKYGFGITGLLALNIVKTIGLVLGTVFRFWAYRTFVFRPAPRPTAATPTEAATPAEAATPTEANLDDAAARNGTNSTASVQSSTMNPLDTDETAGRIPQQTQPATSDLSDPIGVELAAEIAAATRPARR